MDVTYINAFVGSITNVFKTMLGVDIRIGKPTLKDSDIHTSEVSGIIGLSGDVQGCVVMSLSERVACAVASKFAGVELTIKSEDFSDAIGELANMVAGGAKAKFPVGEASISLPSVVVGKDHMVLKSKESPVLVIPCASSLGDFNLEVSLIAKRSPVPAGSCT